VRALPLSSLAAYYHRFHCGQCLLLSGCFQRPWRPRMRVCPGKVYANAMNDGNSSRAPPITHRTGAMASPRANSAPESPVTTRSAVPINPTLPGPKSTIPSPPAPCNHKDQKLTITNATMPPVKEMIAASVVNQQSKEKRPLAISVDTEIKERRQKW